MKQNSAQQKRIDDWIERLERTAAQLLEDVEISELTAKERFDLSMKCIGHIQRFVMIGQQLDSGTTDGSTQTMIAAIMRQMRGETSLPVPGDDGEEPEHIRS
jgi:hypothetical protein